MKSYEGWLLEIPAEITDDSLWKMETYRLGLFIGDIAWYDATKLISDRRALKLSDQLYRATGLISANVAEGYSRGTGKDRARFYEYSLGSARESRDWYYKGRHILGAQIIDHRLKLLTQIMRLLLTMIPQQRGRILREERETYQANLLETPPDHNLIEILKREIPIP